MSAENFRVDSNPGGLHVCQNRHQGHLNPGQGAAETLSLQAKTTVGKQQTLLQRAMLCCQYRRQVEAFTE